MSEQKKVVRDGKVAVLYSPGYGAGWFSWNSEHPDCLFNPELVALVEKRNDENYEWVTHNIREKAEELYGKDDGHFYTGGAGALTIEWVPEGTLFRINEYDGYESVILLNEEKYITA